MDYKVTVKDLELTNAIENYIKKRFQKVERFMEDGVHVDIKLEKDANNYVGKALIHYLGKDIVVTEKSDDIYNLIDILSDAFEKKLKREKEHTRTRNKSNLKGLGEVFTDEMPQEEKSEKISSVKRVNLMITSVEEAIAQMEVMNHEFFVFRNMETDEINMILKGKDGKFILYEFQE